MPLLTKHHDHPSRVERAEKLILSANGFGLAVLADPKAHRLSGQLWTGIDYERISHRPRESRCK
jgi:hypothetical protein